VNFVYADESRKLLHLIYVGTLDKAAAQAVLAATRGALPSLTPGFDVLSDLRELKAVDKEAIAALDELMDLINAHGVGQVVRILPAQTEDFGFGIMSLFHYGHAVRIVTCLHLEEAVARLATHAKGSGHTPGENRPPVDGSPKPTG